MAAVTNVLALPPGNTFETALGKMLSLGKLPDLGLTWLYRFFSPANLFTNGEQGAWYDPSDMSTLYQDAAGTTPVTAVEQPVGLMLDKSKGLVLGPELVVNGDFSSGTTGWSATSAILSVTNGIMRVTNETTTTGVGWQTISTVAGQSYVFLFDRVANNGASRLTINAGVAPNYNGSILSYAIPSSGPKQVIFTATSNQTTIGFYVNSSTVGLWLEIDNISVRELPGAHAFQTTATSRPVLSARVNLLTKTEQFDDAVWTKARASTAVNTVVAPDGTLTADEIVETTDTNTHFISQDASAVSGTTYTFSVFLKKRERHFVALSDASVTVRTATFDLELGQVVAQNSSITASSINHVGDGWYRCSISFAAASTVVAARVALMNATGAITPIYTGDGTSGIYIWGASLVPADQADLPYQRVNTATDYDSDPAKFPRYLLCDGIDDGMVTSTITPATDKMTVWAGVRKLSDAAVGIVAELSANSGLNNGSFFFVSSPDSTAGYAFRSHGSLPVTPAVNSGSAAPITNVLTGIGDISGDSAILRVNGSQAGQSTADQGTGNYLAYPLYLFRRGGTSLPFNGHFYGGIIRFGDNLPIETIEQTEAYMAAKTGVTL